MDRRASLWVETEPSPVFERLHGEIEVDVAVVGAGFTGITTALLLARDGARVALLDMNRIAAGESARSTAHLSQGVDIGYRQIESKFGEEEAAQVAQSMAASLRLIADLVAEYRLDCDFERVPEYLFTEDPSERAEVALELAALQRAGVPAREVVELPYPLAVAGAILLPNQAQLHPRRYLLGLASVLRDLGGHVYERTRCTDIEEGRPCRVICQDGLIRAEQVVLATHVPVTNRFALHTKLAPYRTYVIAAKTPAPVPRALMSDWARPYHYVRSHPGLTGDYLLIGGEDHHTGHRTDTEHCYQRLEAWARDRFAIEEVVYHWSGQIIQSADGLPFIGRNPGSDRVFVATGYAGNGTTFATAAAILLREQLTGRHSRLADVYRANRLKPLAQARRAISQNVDYASHLLTDRVDRGDVKRLEDIPRGEGRLVRMGTRMVAVYCDTAGVCHFFSAVCPHLGCYVHWNEAEQSWDCPCHGSRFDPMGTVINGPAVADLEPLELGPTFAGEGARD